MSTLAPTSPAGAVSQAALPVSRWIDEARTLGVALSNDGSKLAKVTRDGDTLICHGYGEDDPCKGFLYRQYCHHTTSLADQLPVRLFPCGNCREAVCSEPRTSCANCLQMLTVESERIAAERIALHSRPSASSQVMRSPEYLAAMEELIRGVDIWV